MQHVNSGHHQSHSQQVPQHMTQQPCPTGFPQYPSAASCQQTVYPAMPSQQESTKPQAHKRGDVWEIPIQHVNTANHQQPEPYAKHSHQQYPYPSGIQASKSHHSHQGQRFPTHDQPSTGHSTLPRSMPSHSNNIHTPQGSSQTLPRQPVTIPIIHEGQRLRNPSPARSPRPGMRAESPLPHPVAQPQQQPPQPQHHGQANLPPETPTPDYDSPTTPSPAKPNLQQAQSPAPGPPKTEEERAFDIINGVLNEVKALEDQVNNFNGKGKDKQYRYLEEMLTRTLLKLDSVQAGHHEKVRQARKQAVRLIQSALDFLELKAHAAASKPLEDAMSLQDANESKQMSPATSASNTNNSSTFSSSSSSKTPVANAKSPPPPQQEGKNTGKDTKSSKPTKDPCQVKEMQLDSEIPC